MKFKGSSLRFGPRAALRPIAALRRASRALSVTAPLLAVATVLTVVFAGAGFAAFAATSVGDGARAGAAACGSAHAPRCDVAKHAPPSLTVAASRGVAELIDADGDHSRVGWDPQIGLWFSENSRAHWWQSALALRTLIRYLERTDDTSATAQQVILKTYKLNLLSPHAWATTNFVNPFLDDTAWWGLAWLQAANYELYYLHDKAQATTFMREAEWDAEKVAGAPKGCGGIAWRVGYPADTIANAEYIALAASLSRFEAYNRELPSDETPAYWLSQAQSSLSWLTSSGLINLRSGYVFDGFNGSCKFEGGPMTYTEGEVAEALTQLALVTGNRSYLTYASRFLWYVTWRGSHMTSDGVLQEPCESEVSRCETLKDPYNYPAYKGVFMQAMSDWSQATGSKWFRHYMLDQASAILSNDITDGHYSEGYCATPHTCQFGFHWGWLVLPDQSQIGVTVATQASALDALTAVLPPASTAKS